jgi:hypothetical protein
VELSAKNLKKYEEAYRQDDRPPYPLRPVINPMTGLPALLNGYLLASPKQPGDFIELADTWLQGRDRDDGLTLALFGAGPTELFTPPNKDHPARLARVGVLQSNLNSGEDAQRATYHASYQQWHTGTWPVYGGRVIVHGRQADIRVSASNSYLPLRPDRSFTPKIDADAASEIAQDAFKTYVRNFRDGEWRVALITYARKEQFIFPFRDRFWVAYRFETSSELGDEAWRVFVDAEEGQVLGTPERLTAQTNTNAFFLETSADAGQPNLVLTTAAFSFDDLQTALTPYLEGLVNAATGAALDLTAFQAPAVPPPPVVNIQLEAANIAYHTQRTLDYFVASCGADRERLKAYDYTYDEWQGAGPHRHKVTVSGHVSPPMRLLEHKPAGDTLAMGFVSAASVNPKRITFQTLPEPPPQMIGGPVIHNPSLDPEVIQHELAHAIMWLLNPMPFSEQTASVPFTRALLEGYATYFARSLANRHPDDAAVNLHVLWGAAAYREADGWGNTWGFDRSTQDVGADILTAPNVYPIDATGGLPMYELGMVWARGLWDVRQLLASALGGQRGVELADRLALDGFYSCHGLISSFQVAAEGLLDSATRNHGLNLQLVQQMRTQFVTRGICTP